MFSLLLYVNSFKKFLLFIFEFFESFTFINTESVDLYNSICPFEFLETSSVLKELEIRSLFSLLLFVLIFNALIIFLVISLLPPDIISLYSKFLLIKGFLSQKILNLSNQNSKEKSLNLFRKSFRELFP